MPRSVTSRTGVSGTSSRVEDRHERGFGVARGHGSGCRPRRRRCRSWRCYPARTPQPGRRIRIDSHVVQQVDVHHAARIFPPAAATTGVTTSSGWSVGRRSRRCRRRGAGRSGSGRAARRQRGQTVHMKPMPWKKLKIWATRKHRRGYGFPTHSGLPATAAGTRGRIPALMGGRKRRQRSMETQRSGGISTGVSRRTSSGPIAAEFPAALRGHWARDHRREPRLWRWPGPLQMSR